MRKRFMLPVMASLVAAVPLAAEEMGLRQTRDYVQAVGQSDAFEILEAEIALTQSKDPRVRAFAQQMLQDHVRISQSLAQATAASGLRPPPTGVGADQAPLLAALQSVREPEFDKTYWRHQVIAHSAAMVTAEKYAAEGNDPTVRQAARASLPIITSHLTMANQNAM